MSPIALMFLMPAAYWDIKHRLVPNWIPLGIFCLAVCNVLMFPNGWRGQLLGLLLTITLAVPSYFLQAKNKTIIGGGDVKLIIALGALAGPYAIMGTLFVASVVGLIYLLITRKKNLPFAPFLSIGYLVANIFIFISKS